MKKPTPLGRGHSPALAIVMRTLLQRLLRVGFRAGLRREERRGNIPRTAGRCRLWGYGLTMAFPERRIWLYQMLDVFVRDCYGVRKLPAQPRIIDGGANIGAFSLYALWMRPLARIEVVEPDPINLDYLRRNLAQRPQAAIRVQAAALGATRGRARLAGDTSDTVRIGDTPGAAGSETEVLPLSALLTEPVELLKLDIEGSELDVLRAAGAALDSVRRLVLEYHDYRDRPDRLPELLDFLRARGFDRYRVDDHREFKDPDPFSPVHCCLVEAWRAPAGS